MRLFTKQLIARFLILLLSAQVAFAQDYAPPPPGNPPPPPPDAGQQIFQQQELDQMLAPIALYPDALLSQILMAATYPLEVVEAARWSRANPGLSGEQAVNAVAQYNWDPSVKSLVAFPQIIQMMDQKLDWTERLGDAFLSQQPQVMETVQQLRSRAYTAGNLTTTDQIRVVPREQYIVVEPVNPQVVYVPYYDPTVIYGPWWWPAYPPVFWAPWPGYRVYRPGITIGFFFGSGVFLTANFFFGGCDWPERHIHVTQVTNNYFNYNTYVTRQTTIYNNVTTVNTVTGGTAVAWRHDPGHRAGVPYRDPNLRQEFARSAASDQGRRYFRGYNRTPFADRANPAAPAAPNSVAAAPAAVVQSIPQTRASPGAARTQTGQPPLNGPGVASRPDAGRAQEHRAPQMIIGGRENSNAVVTPSRPVASSPVAMSRAPLPLREPQPNAFENVGRGQDARSFSERGHASQPASAAPSMQGGFGGPARAPAPVFAAPPSAATVPAPRADRGERDGNQRSQH